MDSMLILIADDHEVVRRGVHTILASRQNFVVCEASDGKEAVRKAVELNPDLVVLDVTMPMMNGLSAAMQIKKNRPDLPILILSMHEGPETSRAARSIGAQGFVAKTDVACTLLSAVDALLQGQTFFLNGDGASRLP